MPRGGRLILAIVLAVSVFALALVVSQGLFLAGEPRPTPAPEGILRIAWDEPETLDPALSRDTGSHGVILHVFSGLVRLNRELAVEPALAASWQVSPDGRTYTFTLREEARFQDGRAITAADVKYSLERATDPELGSATAATYLGDIMGVSEKLAGRTTEIDGVKVRDERTVTITIDAPKVYFLSKLTYPTAAVVDKRNVESGANWSKQPNGSGSYRVAGQTEDWLILERSQYAYDRGPAPRELRFYVGQRSAMQMYETGQVDVIEVGLGDIERALDPKSPLHENLVVTPSASLFYLGMDTTAEPFDDRDARRAFAQAIDKDKLVKVTLKGAVQKAEGILPPGLPGYDSAFAGLPYDADAARRSLAASAYRGPANLPPITVTGGLGQLLAEVYWRELDVPMEVQVIQQGYFQGLSARAYQMFITGWVADYPDPENFLDVLLHSNSNGNHGGYRNLEVDSLLERARVETDVQKRLALYRQVERIAVDDAAIVPLYHAVDYRLVSKRIGGLAFTPLGLLSVDGVTVQ